MNKEERQAAWKGASVSGRPSGPTLPAPQPFQAKPVCEKHGNGVCFHSPTEPVVMVYLAEDVERERAYWKKEMLRRNQVFFGTVLLGNAHQKRAEAAEKKLAEAEKNQKYAEEGQQFQIRQTELYESNWKADREKLRKLALGVPLLAGQLSIPLTKQVIALTLAKDKAEARVAEAQAKGEEWFKRYHEKQKQLDELRDKIKALEELLDMLPNNVAFISELRQRYPQGGITANIIDDIHKKRREMREAVKE